MDAEISRTSLTISYLETSCLILCDLIKAEPPNLSLLLLSLSGKANHTLVIIFPGYLIDRFAMEIMHSADLV